MESAFDEKNLTQEMKTDFFRICQEALTNVIDHSKAINVKISIQELADKIQLSIFDTGKGFEIIQEEETPGFVNIRERTESFNGRLSMQTVPCKGTGISVTIAK
jgi:signal transduction histidine kinase